MMCALFIILMFFPVQDSIDHVNHFREETAQQVVYKYAQIARMYGYFTPQILTNMKTDLSTKLSMAASDFSITVTTTPKYRMNAFHENETISFNVSFPVKVIAFPRFWGIADSANQTDFIIQGQVPSELNAP